MRLFPDMWPFGDLQPHSFDFIMADPPWRYDLWSQKGANKSADRHYETMPIGEINALPVLDLAAPDCTLWLWCTAPMFPQQLTTVAAWGFTYCTQGAWVKMTKHGKVAFGTGYGLRGAHEPFIIAKRGEPTLTRKTRSVIHGLACAHSQKPEEAYREAERLMPRANRLELFSRTDRAGWTTWGDQAGLFGEAA